MKFTKLFAFLFAVSLFAACGAPAANINTNGNINGSGNTNAANVNTNTNVSTAQTLTEVPRPQKIAEMMAQRGEQDEAKPVLKIVAASRRLDRQELDRQGQARFVGRFKRLQADEGYGDADGQSHSRDSRQPAV